MFLDENTTHFKVDAIFLHSATVADWAGIFSALATINHLIGCQILINIIKMRGQTGSKGREGSEDSLCVHENHALSKRSSPMVLTNWLGVILT